MINSLTKNPEEVASMAGLIYIHDDVPGWGRIYKRGQPIFVNETGEEIGDPAILGRLKSLAIPPAYREVWISPLADSHLQYTARDEKGRKQYRYHQLWRNYRGQINQARMIQFGLSLPAIRTSLSQDLKQGGLAKNKVLATVVSLMDLTLIRVGNEEYAKENQSYGLTTMREKHVKIRGETIRFEFKGKSSKRHVIELRNRRLAKIVQRCMEVPGYELFQYFDSNGHKHDLSSTDVNQYLKEISQADFSAKDFRTWWATVYALQLLMEQPPVDTKKLRKSNLVATIKQVAKKLGNTPAVCKKNYIHPDLLAVYETGELEEIMEKFREKKSDESSQLSLEEQKALAFLKSRGAS
jgi:DNA topoisomerase I